jgi:hypothetical protein
MTMKPTQAQRRFIKITASTGTTGYRTPFLGGRDAGRAANAWYRTASVCERAGWVTIVREGDAEHRRQDHETQNDAGDDEEIVASDHAGRFLSASRGECPRNSASVHRRNPKSV